MILSIANLSALIICLSIFFFTIRGSSLGLYLLLIIANLYPFVTGINYSNIWLTWLRLGIIVLIAAFIINRFTTRNIRMNFPIKIRLPIMLYFVSLIISFSINGFGLFRILVENYFGYIIVIVISYEIFNFNENNTRKYVLFYTILLSILFFSGMIDQSKRFTGVEYARLPIWESSFVRSNDQLLELISTDERGIIERSKGAYPHNLYYGAILVALLPISLNLFILYNRIIILLINILAVVISNSRGCWIISIIYFLIFLIIKKYSVRNKIILSSIVMMLVIISIFLIIPGLKEKNYLDIESYGRQYFYKDLFKFDIKSILFGVGIEKAATENRIDFMNKMNIDYVPLDITFIENIIYMGIISQIIWLYVFIAIGKHLVAKYKKIEISIAKCYINSIVISLIGSLFLASISNSLFQSPQAIVSYAIFIGIALKMADHVPNNETIDV
jgi:hypothetical protein